MTRWIRLLVVAALGIAAPGRAQEGHDDVAVQVTAMAGNNVYIDKGRAAGIEPGDEVTFFPVGQPSTVARVMVVSSSNARAELSGVAVTLPPGTRGTIKVPRARFAPQEKAPGATSKTPPAPAHPPWEQTLKKKDRDTDKPLLAPVSGRTPAERPTRIRGRVWWNTTASHNSGVIDQDFLLTSLGTDLVVSNPIGYGGELRLRGDVSHRRVALDPGEDESTSRGRLDRLAYAYGYTADAPHRLQIGRFLHTSFPELGLVDGVEADTRIAAGTRIGFSAGGFPEPFASQSTGDDTQASLFWRHWSGANRELDVGVAFQKTWHKGRPDRDLLLLNASARPIENLVLYGSAWIDYYTSNEQVQSSGIELTELLLNGSLRLTEDHGVGLGLTSLRWPDLRRTEFTPLTPDQIRNDRVLRASANTWHELSKRVRGSTSLTYWEDQDRDGFSGDAGLTFRDLLFEHGSVEVRGFRSAGAFQTGYGARLLARYHAGATSWHCGYELARYENENPAITSGFDTLHALVGGLRTVLTDSTDLSCNLDYRFGDSQDALTLSAYLQTRF